MYRKFSMLRITPPAVSNTWPTHQHSPRVDAGRPLARRHAASNCGSDRHPVTMDDRGHPARQNKQSCCRANRVGVIVIDTPTIRRASKYHRRRPSSPRRHGISATPPIAGTCSVWRRRTSTPPIRPRRRYQLNFFAADLATHPVGGNANSSRALIQPGAG
jgi:hypothetical protein